MNRFGVATPGHPPFETPVTPIAPAGAVLPRRHRLRFAALAGLLIIVAGGAGFATERYLDRPVVRPPATVPVLTTAATLPPGAVLRAADVTVMDLPRGNLPKGPWLTAKDEAAVVEGDRYATVELPAGALLRPADLTSHRPPPPGQRIVGLDLKGSQAPVQAMPIGAPVVVLTVPDATQPPFPPAQRIGPAEVWYSRPDGSGGTYIDLLVRSGLARTIAGDAAHGEISLIRTGRIPERGRASV